MHGARGCARGNLNRADITRRTQKLQSTGFALGCLSWYEHCPLLDKARYDNPLTSFEQAMCPQTGIESAAQPLRRPASAGALTRQPVSTSDIACRPISAGRLRATEQAAGKQCPKSAGAVVRRKQQRPATKDTLSVLGRMGFDMDFDSTISTNPVANTVKRLRQAFEAGLIPTTQSWYVELESEVLSTLCSIRFSPDGSMLRTVAVDAVRLENSHGNILVEIGEWKEKTGLRVKTVLPGGKRYTSCQSEEFMDDLLVKKLGWLPYQKFVTGAAKESYITFSERYGMNTRYVKTTHRAHIGEGTLEVMKALPLSVHLEPLDPQHQNASSSSESGTAPLDFRIFGAMFSKEDGLTVELYSWLPPEIYDTREDSVTKARLQSWISRSQAFLEKHIEDHNCLLMRMRPRQNRNRFLSVEMPPVHEPPKGWIDPDVCTGGRRGSYARRHSSIGVDSQEVNGFDFEKEMRQQSKNSK